MTWRVGHKPYLPLEKIELGGVGNSRAEPRLPRPSRNRAEPAQDEPARMGQAQPSQAEQGRLAQTEPSLSGAGTVRIRIGLAILLIFCRAMIAASLRQSGHAWAPPPA